VRITKVYTRTGDDGTTGLSKGERLPKDSPRIAAFGALDELSANLGVAMAEGLQNDISDTLESAQQVLFNIGGELAVPDEELGLVKPQDVKNLEAAIDSINSSLPPLKEFVLPRGSKGVVFLHQARGVCRRAERDLVTLHREEASNSLQLQYINRLSDYLFVAARHQNEIDGGPEEMWKK
tara:strand:- start:3014 stop:3553 length:540 start_codon:yes stop_codon:yes gene_type:complete